MEISVLGARWVTIRLVAVFAVITALAIMTLPTASVVALGFSARWLRRRAAAPRWASSVAYAFAALGAIVIAGATAVRAWAILGANGRTPGERSRMLAEAIAGTMYSSSLALLVAVAGGVWVGFCAWRWGRAAQRRVVAGAASLLLVLGVGLVVWLSSTRRARRDEDLGEAYAMVQSIRVAQEQYRVETHEYANVSRALAANQHTNHFALYPESPREHGYRDTVGWGAPCAAQACNPGFDWSILPVHVDGPLRFGYSTIAGRAGERPPAIVTMDGAPVTWPVPSEDWYIITAVGDVEGNGIYTTVLADSFSSDVRIDPGRP
jgi:type IV pilus assembly protein PilA